MHVQGAPGGWVGSAAGCDSVSIATSTATNLHPPHQRLTQVKRGQHRHVPLPAAPVR